MWQLAGTEAHFASTRCRCTIDLSNSSLGLNNVRTTWGDAPQTVLNGHLLQMETRGSSLEEFYTRGQDFFVSLVETEELPFRTQVYWRAIEMPDCYGFEAIVSVQTSRWNVSPRLELTTRIRGKCTTLDGRAALVSLPSSEFTYMEIGHSSNHKAMMIQDDCIRHDLFGGQLEKGVIRRARIRGVFLSATQATQMGSDLRKQFEHSPPPLTT